MAGTFRARMGELVREIGFGEIKAVCNVDQVYAHYQEVNDEFKHPRGGQAHALGASVMQVYNESYEDMARVLLEGDLHGAVSRAAERIAAKYFELAPTELTNLRSSGHPTAVDDGMVYYDRMPLRRRLSDEEIAALDDMRNAINPHHWYGSTSRLGGFGGMLG